MNTSNSNKALIHDIVWIQTAFLGDIILTTAALDLAKKHFPKARQHFITTKLGVKALEAHPSIDQLIAMEKGTKSVWTSFAEVKKSLLNSKVNLRQSIILQPHRSFRSSFLAKYLGIPTITYSESSLSILAYKRIPRVALLHEAARIGLLLEPLGIAREEIVQSRPRLTSLPLDLKLDFAAALTDTNKIAIAISPGSQWGTKRWPVGHFIDLCQHLLREPKINIFLLGAPNENDLCEQIATPLASPDRVFNLATKSPLPVLRQIYPYFKLAICNDSSPLHYASAFNIPVLGIFGPTASTAGFGPLSDRSAVMELQDLVCRPCSAHGPQTCPLGHFKCMKEITPDMVWKTCQKLLS